MSNQVSQTPATMMSGPRPPMPPGGGGGPGGQGGGINLTPKDILGIIRRHLLLIIILPIIGAMIGGGLWFVVRKYNPKYDSVATFQCKMPQAEGAFQALMPQAQILELETNKHANNLKGDSFLSEVLTRREIQATNWYQKTDETKRVKELKSIFSASAMRNSDLVLLRVSTNSAAESQIILQEIMSLYSQRQETVATEKLVDGRQSLISERNRLTQQLNSKQEYLRTLSRTANEPGWERGQTVVGQELSALNQEKLRLEYQQNELLLTIERLREQQNQEMLSANVRMAIEQDPMVMGYRNRISGLEEELARLLDRFGENHREVVEVETRIQSNEQRLRQREQELQEQYAGAEISALERQLEGVQDQLNKLNVSFGEVRARQQDLDGKFADYQETQVDIANLNNRIQGLENQITALTAQIENPSRVRIELFSRPSLAREMSSPRLMMYVPAGFMLGLMFAVGLSFFLELADDSVKTPVDIRRQLNVPSLGMIPEYDEEEEGPVDMVRVLLDKPHSIISEFYRQTKTNLAFSAPSSELKTMLVTSSGSECGKTTVAANLATAFANDGERVLLIDANFRRSQIGKHYKVDNSAPGLSEMLVKRVEEKDVIKPSGIENLDIVTSGQLPPNPANLLNSKTMRDFLAKQRETYDRVFIDGPPALVVTDARVLAGLVDGTIVVVHAGSTKRGVVMRLIRELRESKAHVLGCLLNSVKPRRGGYFQETYQNYYEYINQPVSAQV